MELFSIRIQRTFQLVSTLNTLVNVCEALDAEILIKEKIRE